MMHSLKYAVIAAILTLLLSLWLFGFQFQTQGVHLQLVSLLSTNGGWIGLAVVLVFFAQLFHDQLLSFYHGCKPTKLVDAQAVFQKKHKVALNRGLIIVAVIFLLVLPLFASRSTLDLSTMILIYIMLALGLNIPVGFAGLLDLGYVGFYAVGAYSYAFLNHYLGFSFWESLPIAGILGGFAGFLLGFPVLRLRGDYLAIVTLGFGEIIRILLNNLTSITGGPNGINGIPKPTLFGLEFSRRAEQGGQTFHEFFGLSYSPDTKIIFLYLMAVVLVLITLFVINRMLRMPLGRAWEALRDDEIACRSLGLNPTVIKLTAFTLGATFAGFAGCFFAARQGFISPESFTFMESVIILAIVVLGGMGSLKGIVFASIIMTFLQQSQFFSEYRMLVFGLLLVVMMLWRPQGLVPMSRHHVELPE